MLAWSKTHVLDANIAGLLHGTGGRQVGALSLTTEGLFQSKAMNEVDAGRDGEGAEEY